MTRYRAAMPRWCRWSLHVVALALPWIVAIWLGATLGAQPKAPPQPLPAAPPVPQLSAPEAPPTPLEQMRQLAKNDPATVANVVKAWVGEAK